MYRPHITPSFISELMYISFHPNSVTCHGGSFLNLNSLSSSYISFLNLTSSSLDALATSLEMVSGELGLPEVIMPTAVMGPSIMLCSTI